jgi:hypothetical protein
MKIPFSSGGHWKVNLSRACCRQARINPTIAATKYSKGQTASLIPSCAFAMLSSVLLRNAARLSGGIRLSRPVVGTTINRTIFAGGKTEEDHWAAWQKACWQTYLSSGRGADKLFRSIDHDQTNFISKE